MVFIFAWYLFQRYTIMMIGYGAVILLSWVTFLAVWGVSALNVKRDVSGGGVYGALARYLLWRVGVALGIILALRLSARLNGGRVPRGLVMYWQQPPAILGWIAAALTLCGIAFAIWARVYLGRNWSSRPTVKVDHELVTSGPYRYVRHPIYTGLMLATFGAALIVSPFGFVIFVIIFLVFFFRIDKEEKLMLALFPNEYAAYQTQTKRLIPFLW